MSGAETPSSGAATSRAGALLRAERERQSLGVADVAARLRLSVRQIEALEMEDYASLPGKAFIRGFLRNYAKLLRLDEESVLAAAAGAGALDGGAARIHAPDQNIRFTSSEAISNRRLFLWTSVILGVVALGVAAWRWEGNLGELAQRAKSGLRTPASATVGDAGGVGHPQDAGMVRTETLRGEGKAGGEPPVAGLREERMIPPPAQNDATASGAVAGTAGQGATPGAAVPVPDASAEAPKPGAEATPAASATPAPDRPVAAGRNRIKMSFNGESWVEIHDASGRKVYAKLNTPGSTDQVDIAPPVSLIIGNARDVKLSFNGQSVDLGPHTRVSVARLTLDN